MLYIQVIDLVVVVVCFFMMLTEYDTSVDFEKK